MAKTGSVIYGVIADTHGYPWGRREKITSGQNAETYLFDLGDNTMTNDIERDNESVEVIGDADMILFGNHDTLQNGGQLKGLQILEDNSHKVIIFGLDSCTENDHDFRLQENQIVQLAEKLETLGSDWDVIVLTHIPLFDGNDVTGTCWSEDAPTRTDDLLSILGAYHNHESCTYSGTSYNYSSKTGHVIGCFSGHVHNGFTGAVDGIYVEAFGTNGAETYLPSQATRAYNAGHYIPDTMRISINFSEETVNGVDYTNPLSSFTVKYTSHPSNTLGAQAFGAILSRTGGSSSPKFLSDGTYLGWGPTASSHATANEFSRWQIDSGTITIGNSTRSATHVRWGSNGLLRFYTTDPDIQDTEIPNYNNTSVVFVSNGVHWRFTNGKYEHPKAGLYKFKNSSSSYPAFDSEGYYVGWSDEAEGYLTGGLSSETSSRTWELVDSGTTRIYQNGVHVAAAVQVRFDTDGRLSGFIRSTGTIYSDVSGTIEFMTNGVKWTFYNCLFQSAVSGDSIEVNYTASDQWMDYTTTAYYMTYENGYLMHYRRTNDAVGTQRTDIAGSWASNRTVKFYTNATNAYRDVSAVSQKSLTSITFAGNVSNGFYITEGSFSASYNYARIDTASDTYYFKHVGSQWIMIDIYRG